MDWKSSSNLPLSYRFECLGLVVRDATRRDDVLD